MIIEAISMRSTLRKPDAREHPPCGGVLDPADISPTTHSFSADEVGGKIPDKALIVFTDIDEPVEVDVIRG
ncbi:MAG: hypothetical protein K0Q52_387 [Microbacterium sp.]|jgi:hypothetical protein|nr:hypothetical protein [Microbacterium sp.]